MNDPPALAAYPRDAIVAVATAAGRGAVGIVRASGADLAPLIAAVCGGRALPPRQAVRVDFAAADGAAIDHGLAIRFPAPHSYTGEDVLELHAHGGPVVLQLLLARCLQAQPGLRLARPGEFTERAFLNDKLDLAQAEAVADLIDAGTEAAARSAARSLGGAFSAEIDALAARTVRLRTLVEATLDFPDEEIDFLERADARGQLDAIDAALDGALARTRQGVLLREGLRVVLAGQPNVGKSSLLNALAGAELAIVTPVPGTTRDRIGETLQIDGVPVHVTDTAGLRDDGEAADAVERIGIDRSWQAIGGADAVVLLRDLTRAGDPGHADADAAIAARLPPGVPVLTVWNKADAVPAEVAAAMVALSSSPTAAAAVRSPADAATPRPPEATTAIVLSARTGEGLAALRAALLAMAGWQPGGETVFTARTRHLEALRATRQHLAGARAHLDAGDAALELLAEELRFAHTALSRITGAFTTEDLLGEIFGRFCIGK